MIYEVRVKASLGILALAVLSVSTWVAHAEDRVIVDDFRQKPKPPAVNVDALLQEAAGLERMGRGADAVRLYVRAALAGSGKAAQRLGEIYDHGISGVARNYAESLRWYDFARVMGEATPPAR